MFRKHNDNKHGKVNEAAGGGRGGSGEGGGGEGGSTGVGQPRRHHNIRAKTNKQEQHQKKQKNGG